MRIIEILHVKYDNLRMQAEMSSNSAEPRLWPSSLWYLLLKLKLSTFLLNLKPSLHNTVCTNCAYSDILKLCSTIVLQFET